MKTQHTCAHGRAIEGGRKGEGGREEKGGREEGKGREGSRKEAGRKEVEEREDTGRQEGSEGGRKWEEGNVCRLTEERWAESSFVGRAPNC